MGFTLYNIETGARHDYTSGRVTFGRKELEGALSDCGETIPLGLAIALKHVSLEHIRIIQRDTKRYEVMNLSKNGTCVNGKMITGGIAEVRHGDVIRLGPDDVDIAPAFYFLDNGGAEEFIAGLEESANAGVTTQDFKPDEGGR